MPDTKPGCWIGYPCIFEARIVANAKKLTDKVKAPKNGDVHFVRFFMPMAWNLLSQYLLNIL
ncbi:hypothetical protein [Paenibacillus luteus]|uniref:hypothetical protein n=1 Tax=Paenibacillus luteus TaxID=2545753 RepID=UPI001144B265|nr:hypothetical protein [Paenibacillus luteus]